MPAVGTRRTLIDVDKLMKEKKNVRIQVWLSGFPGSASCEEVVGLGG
jgi:hypothetical protein